MRVVDSETRRAVRQRRLAALEADNYLDEVAEEGADDDHSEDDRDAPANGARRQGEVCLVLSLRVCVNPYVYFYACIYYRYPCVCSPVLSILGFLPRFIHVYFWQADDSRKRKRKGAKTNAGISKWCGIVTVAAACR
jgi:hypothetical protein